MALRLLCLRVLPLALLLLCLSALSTAHAAPPPEPAADAVVTTCTEAGFNMAFTSVQGAGGGTITFACSGTIVFTSQKQVTTTITIDGSGQNVVLSGGNGTRHFFVFLPGVLDLRDLRLINGLGRTSVTGSYGGGGSILALNATVRLTDVTLHHNNAPVSGGATYPGGAILGAGASRVTATGTVLHHNSAPAGGGAIYNDTNATLVLSGGEVYSNTTQWALGGAIYNRAVMTATGTVFFGNTLLVDVPGQLEWGAALYNHTGARAVLRDVVMRDNQSRFGGGAIMNAGTMTVEGGRFVRNLGTTWGGAIANGGVGPLTIEGARFADNRAALGGAIYVGWFTTIRDSDFEGNGLPGSTWGGALYFHYTAVGSLLERVTLRNNLGDRGGGIYGTGTTLTVRTSTLSNNRVSGPDAAGGAIFSENSTMSLRNVTLYRNTVEGDAAAGGLETRQSAPSQTDVLNTIVAGNTPRDCRLMVNGVSFAPSAPYSLAGDSTCGFLGVGVLNGANPLLGPLADNGGFTLTHLPAANSPAVDAGTDADCLSPDQRGSVRPVGAACDIGAVEYNPALPATATPTATPTPTPTPTPTVTPTHTPTLVPGQPTHTPTHTPVAAGTEVFLPAVQK